MENKNEFILEKLSKIFEVQNETKLDTIMLYSILERNMENIDLILNFNDDDDIEMKASELKEFVTDFKILKSFVQQMIHKNTSLKEQDEIKKEYHIQCKIDKDTESPSISHLMSYNYFLQDNPQLFNLNLEKFVDYLQIGNAESAKLSFEELSYEQKKSVPDKIYRWIQSNSHKY